MDSNDKNNFRLDPRPPHAGPSVQASSVHVCNAGNVNACLNVTLESCAGLEIWLAGIMVNAPMLEHAICSRLLRI
jgi:hypothetical protein